MSKWRFRATNLRVAVVIGFWASAVAGEQGDRLDFAFSDVAAERGVLGYVMVSGFGGGVAAADFDDDGDIDFFAPTSAGSPNLLFRNRGDGVFDEVGAELGVGQTFGARAALWMDFNGDRRLDLVVAGDCFQSFEDGCADGALWLFLQTENGSFIDASEAAGLRRLAPLDPRMHHAGLSAGDVNGDGWLDLVVSVWRGGVTLLINENGESFVDRTAESGIVNTNTESWQAVLIDLDGDGDLDLFNAIDFAPNRLWLNDGTGQFTDVAAQAGVDTAWNDMGVAIGDVDNDGRFDLFITQIAEGGQHNVLHRQLDSSTLEFEEIAVSAGVAETGFAWGCAWLDADLDGDLDLAVTNGWFNGIGFDDRSRMFLNTGAAAPAFDDVSVAVNFNDDDWGSSLAAVDIDRDGDLDLLQTINQGPLRVLENVRAQEGGAGNWLVIKPRMSGPNHRAIGAVVRATVGGVTMMRPIMAGGGFLAQEPAEAHFGVGGASIVDSVEIRWPDGDVTTLHAVPANQALTIEQDACCAPGDLDFNGVVDMRDLSVLLQNWGDCAGACQGDVNFDGAVDGLDLALLLAAWG